MLRRQPRFFGRDYTLRPTNRIRKESPISEEQRSLEKELDWIALEMRAMSLGLTVSSTSSSFTSLRPSSSRNFNPNKSALAHGVSLLSFPKSAPGAGVCKASQVFDLFPTVSPEITVREARIEDCWDVAETHCSSFFPEYSFPLDFVLRVDRLVAMLSGLSVPNGCRRICLVAVIGGSENDAILIGPEDFKIGGFDGKVSLNKGYVAGILTVDTVADFLPRKGPLRQRRTGIAYISNVAVRERFRRKGIAKKLILKAEAEARNWGCRAIALHCDSNNPGATKLYKGRGFKSIKVPEGANWPRPKTSPDINYSFMMKLLKNPTSI